jgi:tRNA threonylcarbamoyl adenosine modification protein (Sua5/YciO/YrdC/YwlC family)
MDTEILSAALAAVDNGELVGIPTDTLYGIAADPFNPDALDRIFIAKGRPGLKPLAILVANLEQAQQLAAFGDRGLELAEEHWPGALTLVLPKLKSVPEWIGDPARRTLGLRCPDHPVALEFLRESGPLAVTSANVSSRPAVLSAEDARELFGDDIAVYLEGEATGGQASTIIDLTQPAEWILRDGPISP